MRSKRTQKPSSVKQARAAPVRETSDKAVLLRGEGALGRNGEFPIRDDDCSPIQAVRPTEDITEHKRADPGVKIVPTTVLAGLGALAALLVLGVLELVLERVLGDAVALSIPVIFGSIAAAGMTYFALRRQEASYQRTLKERERTENARREAERKYRDIFENAVEGIFQTSPDGGFITANPALSRMLGFASPEELIRAREIEGTYYVHPERRVEFKQLLDQQDTVRGFELEAYRKDRTKIWMSDNVRAVRDASGELLYYEGTVEDITDRKQAEEALREAEQKYRDIFENAVEGIFQTTPEGEFITANPALARMLGFDTSEELVRARTDIEHAHYVHPERRVEFKRLLDQHDTVRGFEFEAYRKDGSIIWMSENVRAVRDASGKLVYYEGTTEDISKRKKMEGALRRSEMDLADFFENAAMGLLWVDSDGTILRVNQAELDLLGYTRDEYLGHNITEFHADRRVIEDMLKRLRAGQVLRDYEARLRCKDGSIRFVSINSSVYWEEGRFIHSRCFTRDITERKLAEEALRESEERYRDLVENSRDLICTHDLDGLILSANPAAAAAVGYDLDEFVGKRTIRDLLATEVKDRFDEYMARLRNEGTTSGIMLVQTKSGERRVWEYYNSLRTEGVATPIVRGMARDITEQRRAATALLASERRYRDIFAFAPVGIYQSLRDGTLITANKALAEMLAYDSVDEFLRINLADVYVVPDGRKKLIREYEDRGCAVDLEIQWKRKDGAPIWVQLSAHAIKGANGATEYFEGFVRDVNDRKLTEAALRESETRFSKAFHSNPAPLIITRLDDGRFLNVNDAFLLAFEYERAEVIGETVLSLNIYPNPGDREILIGNLKEQGALRGYESQARTKSGRILDLWVSVEPITLQGQQCILSTAYDVTERKRIEEALRDSEERYRELFENDKDAIYVHDLNGVYTSVNRAAESLSGYSREEIIGKHFRDFVSSEYLSQVGESFCKKLDEKGETNYEVEIINRDGARVPVEVSSRMIYANGTAVGVQGSVRDITERKRAQQALLTYSRRLLKAQEAERGRIARELHDQIGQMLTALKLNLHAIQDAGDAGEVRPLIEDNLKMLEEALEQVRDLSVDLRPLLLDDLGLVTALRWFIDHQAQRTGVRAEFTSDSFDPDLRFSSELEIACFRIAQEALTNVARHARAKAVTVHLSRDRDYLILLIEDDGVGFDIEALQGHALASATLGLRGMQERADAVGGRVKIDSATDRGTQVFVELPIAIPNGRKTTTAKRVRE